eukprot:CAMPEP_0115009838 /NCGR_PEP_ID=MMETSP0216-20121206/22902_1 /TAXON_ID=223996 /ORGANISM="Protocruzia adherens, Strain Boccale" /LENGTH=559 /DNA_ID=CAMNT_0002377825 /DNA_START=49 /DNA_END=1728 /DNA_ORIENTATION=+
MDSYKPSPDKLNDSELKVSQFSPRKSGRETPLSFQSKMVSETAAFRKRNTEMQKKTEALEKANSKLDAKNQEMKAELRKLRLDVESKEKSVQSYKRNTEWAYKEKSDLESQLKKGNEYIRKLESKLASGSKGNTLADANLQMKRKLEATTKANQEQKAKLEAQSKKLLFLTDEIRILNSAMELKVEEFQGVDCDINEQLLKEVADLRDQLAQTRQETAEIQTELDESQEQLEGQKRRADEAEVLKDKLEEDLELVQQQSQRLELEKATIEERMVTINNEKDMLLDYIDEADQKAQHAQKTIEDLRTEINNHMQEKEGMVLDHESALEEKSNDCELAFKEIHSLKQKLSQLEHEFGSQNQKTTEDHQSTISQMEKYYRDELSKKDGYVENLVHDLDETKREKEGFREELEQALGKLREMDQALRMAEESQMRTEKMVRSQMESTRGDLDEISKERDHLRTAMHEAINKCAQSLLIQQDLEKENRENRAKVEALEDSKMKMQEMMNSRLHVMKNELGSLREEKEYFKVEKENFENENAYLQNLIEDEKKRNEQLLEDIHQS